MKHCGRKSNNSLEPAFLKLSLIIFLNVLWNLAFIFLRMSSGLNFRFFLTLFLFPFSVTKYFLVVNLKIKSFEEVIEKIDNEIIDKNNVQFIIQPSSPLNEWNNLSNCLFEFSEVVGKYFEVSTIPQIHKILNIE